MCAGFIQNLTNCKKNDGVQDSAEASTHDISLLLSANFDIKRITVSLAAQISYYNEYIQRHSDWVFAGIYADEAYSGTKDDRPRFVQLIQDCKDGKIDRIITKSISRFARNTVTLLTTVRDLRRMGIGIYFEEQNIDTLTEAGELMITLLASQAQEESRATSENCKWRIRKKFEEGYTTHFNLVGYHQVDGLVKMIPEEAELVKRIFQLYLEGYGQQAIANILFEEDAPTCLGGEWFSTTIRSMLRNEKYAGDLLLQKSFVTDHITKEVKKNKGEMSQSSTQLIMTASSWRLGAARGLTGGTVQRIFFRPE